MTVRELALLMLDEYELEGKYVNLLLKSHRADNLTREERASLTALLYTVTEHKYTYDYYICAASARSGSDIDPRTLNILRLGVCQIVDMSAIPDFAAVNETVKLARNKGEAAFVNAVLRKISRLKNEDKLPLPDRKKNPARYLAVAYSFPLWLAKHFIALIGEEATERLLGHFNTYNSTDLTVNTLKISRDGLIGLLKAKGFEAAQSPISPLTVRIAGSVNPTELPGFDEGYFFVQDSASALSAAVLSPSKGDSIIDVCACPGGKSFAATILAEDGGRVASFDIHESKLSLVTDGAKRLGLNSITIGMQDAREIKEELVGAFDRVICDAPCSGLGVLGKKADMRYRDPEGMKELPELQYEILSAASRYLRVGGYMVYSTCTLNPEENEAVVRRFLDAHGDFALVPFNVGELVAEAGMLTLWPHIHNTDGFFISKLTRLEAEEKGGTRDE